MLIGLLPVIIYPFTFSASDYSDAYFGISRFVSVYLLCHADDEENVVSATRQLLVEHDELSVECLEFTHLPKQHHMTTGVDEVIVIDNTVTIEGVVDPVPAVAEETTDVRDVVVYVPVEIPAGNPPVVGDAQENLGCNDTASRNYTICQDVVEVKNHRRVHKHMQEAYVYSVVAEIKNRLGVPKHNAANLLAVRRMANQIMVKHGVRPTHIRRSIELVIAGVFIPDDHDILGAKVRASNIVRARVVDYENAAPRSFWQRMWLSFSRGEIREEKV